MIRLYATFASLLIIATASVSAQTATTPTSSVLMTQGSLAPSPGSFLFSAGPAVVSDRIDVPSVKMGSTKTGYGGYVALDYSPSKALSFQSELSVTSMGSETNIISAVNRRGTIQTLTLHIPSRTAFHFDVGAKLYPLQLTEYTNFRLQPFAKVAMGGVVYAISDVSPSIGIDPCPFITAGGGTDVAFNARWSATAEVDYYSSISDPTFHTQGVALTARNDGILGTARIRYRF